MAPSSSWRKQRNRGRRRKWGVLASIKTWISSLDYCHQIPCLDWGLGGLIQQRAAHIIQKAGRIVPSNWAHLVWMTENHLGFDTTHLKQYEAIKHQYAAAAEWRLRERREEGNHQTHPKCIFPPVSPSLSSRTDSEDVCKLSIDPLIVRWPFWLNHW